MTIKKNIPIRRPSIQPLPDPTLPPEIAETDPRLPSLDSIRSNAEVELSRLAKEQALHLGMFGESPISAAPGIDPRDLEIAALKTAVRQLDDTVSYLMSVPAGDEADLLG